MDVVVEMVCCGDGCVVCGVVVIVVLCGVDLNVYNDCYDVGKFLDRWVGWCVICMVVYVLWILDGWYL